MFNITQLVNVDNSLIINIKKDTLISRCVLSVVGIAALVLVGCGQKGELYLVDPSSQTVTSSSAVLESTSNPQDAAFAGIDDGNYQKTRYLEQKQVLPESSDDPNDY